MTTDVWVEGDRIVALGPGMSNSSAQVVEADGMLVGPGFVDLHAHLREPGQTAKEDIASGTRAAAAGGYTAVVAMPNTEPATDNPDLAIAMRRAGEAAGNALVVPAGALTRERRGEEPSDLEGLYAAGVRLFTDDGDGVADTALLEDLMRRLSALPGAVLAQHAETPELTGAGQVHDGAVATRLGVPGIPVESETRMAQRDLRLAESTGAPYHLQHVSAAATLDLVRRARAAGIEVTVEVTPHHLSFDEGDIAYAEPNLKMYPPLRTTSDRSALIAGLADRSIDVVATDHAPHTAEEKALPFVEAPRGVIGLETAAAAVWGALGHPARFFDVMSTRPAAIVGLTRHGAPIEVGSPANLVVFDPDREWVASEFVSKSSNSPYMGLMLRGRPVMTVFEGVITHQLEPVC
jgi:dihydroorotase